MTSVDPPPGSTARAFWLRAPGHGEIRGQRLPPPAAGEVQVRALYSGISRGTEALVFNGQVPSGEYQRMRAPLQEGEFPGPVKYGYASVGVVERGPPALLGVEVFCLHPHQTRYLAPVDAVHTLPQGVPAARAVLAANMETALNALWDAGLRLGDRVAVVGSGVLGCLVAFLAARVPGCRVELVDINPARAAVATALGAAFMPPASATPEADLVVHASGSAEGLATALSLAGFESTVLELSWYGTRSVAVPLGEAFHSRRLVLRASQVGAVATAQRARWSHVRRMGLALALLADARLDCLLSAEDHFDDLPAVMARVCAPGADVLCHRIRYG